MPLNNVGMFSQEALQHVIDDTLQTSDIPADHKIAVVGSVDDNGIKAVAVFTKDDTLGNKWKFEGAFEHDWAGDNRVGARVIFTR